MAEQISALAAHHHVVSCYLWCQY